MPRPRKQESAVKFKELDLDQARREFSRKRSKGSKYDKVLEAVEKLEPGRALLVEQVTYSEVANLRNRIRELIGEEISLESTKVDRDQNLYDMLVQRRS